jgi:predicted SAM-dependent methyltransferase
MKLHLGCGENYLKGYKNIDFPPAEHTVQTNSVADEFHDIRSLKYPSGSVGEIRLHHVFEHFERFRACAFIASWNSWLKKGGTLRIEVPDFGKTMKKNFGGFGRKKYEGVGLRHIFGSQEAAWAVHFEGYTESRLKGLFALFGFGDFTIERIQYKHTFNIDISGRKKKTISRENCYRLAEDYLSGYLLDSSDTEKSILKVWLGKFDEQMNFSFAG